MINTGNIKNAANAMPFYNYLTSEKSTKTGRSHYELKDHLGNIRTVISDSKLIVDSDNSSTVSSSDNFVPEVRSAMSYYPFGMKMPGTEFYSGAKPRYDYNGKETDQESGLQDYGMRIYDKRIGKFLSVDPLTKQYSYLTPYAFAENDVISSIDLDGLEKYRVVGRSFAPRGSFGASHFESKADDRTKFEIADYMKVSARIHIEVGIDLDAWSISKKIQSQNTIVKGGSSWKVSQQEINAKPKGSKDDKQMEIEGDYSAKNGTEIGPGIDIQFDIKINNKYKDMVTVSTNLTGNIFPAQETMIFDEKGTGIFLGTSTAKGSPLTGVWGDGKENKLSKSTIAIATDDNGNFMGVYSQDKNGNLQVTSPDAYNKTFTERMVWDGQDGREDYEQKK
jgi:RHS repeat-associated protein